MLKMGICLSRVNYKLDAHEQKKQTKYMRQMAKNYQNGLEIRLIIPQISVNF